MKLGIGLHLKPSIVGVGGGAGITILGSVTANARSWSINLSSLSLAENDVVVITSTMASSSDVTLTMTTTGYTMGTERYANDINDCNFVMGYKRMGSTPDTTVVGNWGGNTNHAAFTIATAYRGVNTTNVLDLAEVGGTSTNSLGIDPPTTLTPTVAGCMVVVGVGGAGDTATTGAYNTPSDLTDITQGAVSGGVQRAFTLVGHKLISGTTAFDAATVTHAAGDADDSSATSVLVLRPE